MKLYSTVILSDADIRYALACYINNKHPTVNIERDKITIRVNEGQREPNSYSAEVKVELP